jgi:hypothetical protein
MTKIKAFILGFIEFRSGCGMTYANEALTVAYDKGRDLAHRLTFRHYEA